METTTHSEAMEPLSLVLGGMKIAAKSELEVRAPEDGHLIAVVGLADEDIFLRAIAAAESARQKCEDEPSQVRSLRLLQIADAIEKRKSEFAATIRDEAGKPQLYAEGEVDRAIQTFRLCAAAAEDTLQSESCSFGGKRSLIQKFPIGVNAFITPFNFPLNLVAHKIGPAIAVGCPFILKPAEKTPLSASLLAEVIMGIDHPPVPESWSVLPAVPSQSGPLIRDHRIKHLSFTGSAEVGWKLKSLASHARVTLELGGNAASIIVDDWDMNDGIESAGNAAFAYSGQVCISLQRLFVPQTQFEDYCEGLAEHATGLLRGSLSGPNTKIGPMINEDAAIRAEEWVNEAISLGATLHCGGHRDGNFFSPTVLSGVPQNCRLWNSEVFAPILIIEPWSDFEIALEQINNSEFGLQASIYTNNETLIKRAFQRLEIGQLIVGGPTIFRSDDMPYGGVKASGCGREGVKWAIEAMQELKAMIRI